MTTTSNLQPPTWLSLLARAARILSMEGLGDITLGHVSAREPGAEVFWMKGADLGLEEVSVADFVLLDFDGIKLQGVRRRHGEYPIHAEVYRARPDVNAVIHVHPVHATVFSALDQPLRPITHDGVLFVPPPPRFSAMTDLILTHEQGQQLTASLGNHPALLMRNHGVLVAARDIQDACLFTLMLERAARAQLLLGERERFDWTDDSEVQSKRANVFSEQLKRGFWQYYLRKLERLERSQGRADIEKLIP